MKIKKVVMNSKVKIKVYEKHNVTKEEIEDVLKKNRPIFRRVGGKQHLAIGNYNRYLTIYFHYDKKTKEADITTAFPSSKKEVKFYRKDR